MAILQAAGFNAVILYETTGFKPADLPRTPVATMDTLEPDENDIFVIPEGMPRIMRRLKDHLGRRFVIALSWHYVFSTLPDGLDWRQFNIERVMSVSPVIARLISWSMRLPVHLLSTSIDHHRYYQPLETKALQIAYIKCKALHVDKLRNLLGARNADYIYKIKWLELGGVSRDLYAAEIRRSSVFLSTSVAEGNPTSCLEAMAAGAIVAGYDAVGGKGILFGDGPGQNCLLSPNGDYVSLAYRLAPLLDDLIKNRMERWKPMISRAAQVTAELTDDGEANALINFWRQYAGRQKHAVTMESPAISFAYALTDDGATTTSVPPLNGSPLRLR